MISKIEFSVIIPSISDNELLRKNLNYLNKQNFKNFEVILVIDKAIKIYKKNYNFKINIIRTNNKKPGAKRNLAAKLSKGRYLAFLDDDSYPTIDWLSNINKFLLKNNNKNIMIGGPGVLPLDDNFFSRLVNLFFISIFLGKIKCRYLSVKKYNNYFFDDWPSVNLFISKKKFLQINGYDPNTWPGEDSKLCMKFIKQSGKIIYLSNLIVYHYRRANFVKYTRQIFRYAKTRGFFFKNFDQNSFKIIYVLPSVTLFYLVYFLLNIKFNLINFIFIAILIFLISYDAILSFKNEKNILILIISRLVILYSFIVYGVGFLYGLFSKKNLSSLGR